MTTLIVPALENEPWPTLGPQVCRFIEQNLVFGPGDLRGRPAKIDPDKRLLIYRAYEVYPQDHPQAGRRRFQRVAFSLRKGLAKTELAAWIAACELHPAGPVRCDGFREGQPIGRGVTDPYIPMVAYTEEQTEDLAYAALLTILGEGPLAADFDLGLTRITRVRGDGKAVALAAAPDARDGARTTFQHFDETHRFTLPRLKLAHKTMLANLPKRRASDAWALETTTAYATGENSVAEDAMTYARTVDAGDRSDSRLFFFHRQASPELDFDEPEQLRQGIVEASGGDDEWLNIDTICAQFDDPTADRLLLERLWGNRPVAGGGRAFPIDRWDVLGKPGYIVPERALITLGFDGSRFGDATALIGTEVFTGHQWPLGIWTPPTRKQTSDPWEVNRSEVNEVVRAAFRRWNVWAMYCDPPEWDSEIAEWRSAYGDRVKDWYTRRPLQMAYAIANYRIAMIEGTVSHDGDPLFRSHIANAVKRELTLRDEQGIRLATIEKERPDSPFKIDATVAGAVSWQARVDAVASGARPRGPAMNPDYDRSQTGGPEMAGVRGKAF